MSAVEKYLFTPLYYPDSTRSVIRWWEVRRLFFNICVGGAGLLSLATASLFAHLPPLSAPLPFPLRVILIYGILANAGYSMGAVADLVLRRMLGERASALAPALFRYGLAFSVGLTLLPIPLSVLGWLIRLIG